MKWHESLQKVRKKKGFTQQEIADHFITTQQQYSKYETGNQEMTVSRVVDLCKLFNVSADQLLGLDYFEQPDGKVITKMEMLYNEVIEIIYHAERNEYISEEATDILIDNLNKAYADILKEGNNL